MAELERLLVDEVRPTRPDELLANELEQQRRDAARQRRRRQLFEGADVEDLAHHCRAAEHASLVGAEALEARRQEGVDPGRDADGLEVAHRDPAAVDLHEPPLVDQHRDHLLDEQRIAFRPGGDVIAHVEGGLRLAEQLGDQTVAGRRRPAARASRWCFGPGAWPQSGRRSRRSGRLTQSRRIGTDSVCRATFSISARSVGLSPVGVVEHDDERPSRCEARKQPSHGPEALLDDSLRLQEPGELGDRLGDRAGVVGRARATPPASRPRRPRRRPRGCPLRLLDHLGERPERDPVAVGKAAPAEHRRPLAEAGDELVGEPRLADSGRADDGDEAAALLRDRSLERPLQLGEGVLAADERSLQARRQLRSPLRRRAAGRQRPALCLPLSSSGAGARRRPTRARA